ncbi:hypothetical protein [Arcanobacterium phocae]|nr:hypothetical protein [Arcanobacterium phocae]
MARPSSIFGGTGEAKDIPNNPELSALNADVWSFFSDSWTAS